MWDELSSACATIEHQHADLAIRASPFVPSEALHVARDGVRGDLGALFAIV